MVKNILIPIDFRVASLNTLKLAFEFHSDVKLNVILVYGTLLDDSITEMLFYSDEKIINSKRTEEFNEALEIIKNRFEGNIIDIQIRLIHFKQSNYLNHFLNSHHIDEIILPAEYQLQQTRKGLDIIPALKKMNFPIRFMKWKLSGKNSEKEQLSELFN